MGNLDLIIIINNTSVFLILGTDYETRNGAIRQAIIKFEENCKEIYKQADKPEEFESDWDEIKEIKVYEFNQ